MSDAALDAEIQSVCAELDAEAKAHGHEEHIASRMLRDLRRDNARLREAQTWRPIETAPRDGRGLLGLWPHWTAFPVRIWWQNNQWHMAEDHPAEWHDDMPREHGPTHWMPLPDATQETARAADYIHRPTLLSDLKSMLQGDDTPEAETTNAAIRAVMDVVRGEMERNTL